MGVPPTVKPSGSPEIPSKYFNLYQLKLPTYKKSLAFNVSREKFAIFSLLLEILG